MCALRLGTIFLPFPLAAGISPTLFFFSSFPPSGVRPSVRSSLSGKKTLPFLQSPFPLLLCPYPEGKNLVKDRGGEKEEEAHVVGTEWWEQEGDLDSPPHLTPLFFALLGREHREIFKTVPSLLPLPSQKFAGPFSVQQCTTPFLSLFSLLFSPSPRPSAGLSPDLVVGRTREREERKGRSAVAVQPPVGRRGTRALQIWLIGQTAGGGGRPYQIPVGGTGIKAPARPPARPPAGQRRKEERKTKVGFREALRIGEEKPAAHPILFHPGRRGRGRRRGTLKRFIINVKRKGGTRRDIRFYS